MEQCHPNTLRERVGGRAGPWASSVPPHAWLDSLADGCPAYKTIEKRLHFESGLRNILLAASALFAEVNSLANKKPSRCVAVLDTFPLKAVQAVYLALPAGTARQKVQDYLETWRHVKPKTTGHDLKRRGLPPGPKYQSILLRLRDARLDGEVKSVDDEKDLLEKLINP
jgi:tRNA nucleotidyltransferase (CCA-adding enzyme)